MIDTVFAIALIIFGAPPISLDWKGGESHEFQFIFREASEPCKDELVKGSREVQYRFMIQGCDSSPLLGRDCGRVIREIHHIRFDPITESYKVMTDRLGDDFEPRSVTFKTIDEALGFAQRIDSVTFETIRARSPGIKFEGNAKAFIRAKVIAECKDSLGEVLSWIPHIITLGIIDRTDYDSGWYNFSIE
jgi:hypothetical protein